MFLALQRLLTTFLPLSKSSFLAILGSTVSGGCRFGHFPQLNGKVQSWGITPDHFGYSLGRHVSFTLNETDSMSLVEQVCTALVFAPLAMPRQAVRHQVDRMDGHCHRVLRSVYDSVLHSEICL